MIEAVPRRDESLVSAQIAEIFSEHADFVWRSLRRLGVPARDADDALQEVFLVVHRRISEYEDRGLMRAWLFSICRQVASHYHRGARRSEERHRGLPVSVVPREPDEAFARREADRFVHQFLEQLDEPRRLVFYLSDIEGLSAPEIAAALQTNVNTVYGRLRQARLRFEAAVAQREQEGRPSP